MSGSASTDPVEIKQWRVRNREYKEDTDGQQFTRKIDPTTNKLEPWFEVLSDNAGPSSSSIEEAKRLCLILLNQSEGEPLHWCLFVVRGESSDSKGAVWQVTGDAKFMHYDHASEVPVFGFDIYSTSYVLNQNLSKEDEQEIERAVETETPPQAKDRRSVKENCQGWTIRVLRRLESRCIVAKKTVDWIETDLKQPV